ncbi:MAG: acyl carrier protein [Chloroflexi bacterium]|nr:acyl carrier protein [Chloroflexota bacterium]
MLPAIFQIGDGNVDIRQQIKQFIAQNFLFTGDADSLDEDTSFMEEGIVDSMGTLELILFVEETFQFLVADDEIEPDNFDSVNNLCRYIQRKTAVAAVVS